MQYGRICIHILKLRSLWEYDHLVSTNCIMMECSVALSTPLQVLDKLEGGQDIHGADIALKRHEAIRTDVEARVSGWGGGGEGVGWGWGGEGWGWGGGGVAFGRQDKSTEWVTVEIPYSQL